MIKKLCLAAVATLVIAPAAMAIPTLQVYLPGAQYDAGTETWLYTGTSPFRVDVIGTYGTATYLDKLTLDIAIPGSTWDPTGTISVTGPGYLGGATISSFHYGTPAREQSHGIYPTYYYSLALPDMNLKMGTDVTHDYSPGGFDSTGTGVIFEYTIDPLGFEAVHFDASADSISKTGKVKSIFAPYSHDGEAWPSEPPSPPTVVAEPAGLGLIGVGMLLVLRRRRK